MKWLKSLIKTYCNPEHIVLVFSFLGQNFLWIRPSYPAGYNLKIRMPWDNGPYFSKKKMIFFSNRTHFSSYNEDPRDWLVCIIKSVLFSSRNNLNFNSNYLGSKVIRIWLIKIGKVLFLFRSPCIYNINI